MKIFRPLIFLTTLIIINGCVASKAEKHLREGKTIQENYKVTIPFEIKNGFIILKVKIGNDYYDFMLDTGASNVYSKELAEALNLKIIGSESIFDIYNKPQITEYARIDKIGIGGVDYIETIGVINDFNSIPNWSSLKVAGFIGSNLMRHSIWDFDFRNNIITITDNETKLNLPNETIENKLFIGYASIPSIACKINGTKIWNFTVDFGFNGGIIIPFSEFEKQIESTKISDYKKSKTEGVIGVYGKQNTERESYTGTINEIEFGNSTLIKERVYSEQNVSKLFGLDFFRDYRVILNWETKKIKLIRNDKGTK